MSKESEEAGGKPGGEGEGTGSTPVARAQPKNGGAIRELAASIREFAAALKSSRESNKKPLFQRMAAWLWAVPSLVIGGLVALLTIVLLAGTGWKIFEDSILKEPFQRTVLIERIRVPKALADNGYSQEVVTQRLIDEMMDIRNKAKTKMQIRGLAPAWRQVDIEVPGAGLTVNSVIRWAKDLVGFPDPRYGGEITRAQGKLLQLRLRRIDRGGGAPADPPPKAEAELDDLLGFGARELMKVIDPYVLASYFRNQKKPEAALDMIAYCLAHEPLEDDAWAHNLWGVILTDQSEYDEAIEKYQAALEENPEFDLSLNNRGVAWLLKGKHDRAIEDFTDALRLKPDNSEVLNNRGLAWSGKRGFDQAIEDFTAALRLSPDHHEALNNRGVAWSRKGKHDRAIEDFTDALRLKPDYHEALNNFVWLLATAPDARLRDGRRAVTLAEKAVSLGDDAGSRDTLAAAFAEAGRFPDAVSTQERAVAMARTEGKSADVIADLEDRLRLYSQNRPYRETP